MFSEVKLWEIRRNKDKFDAHRNTEYVIQTKPQRLTNFSGAGYTMNHNEF